MNALNRQREHLREPGLDLRPWRRAPAHMQHHAQDAEPRVPEASVAHFCGGFLRFMTMSR
jgi:hypothetical protein